MIQADTRWATTPPRDRSAPQGILRTDSSDSRSLHSSIQPRTICTSKTSQHLETGQVGTAARLHSQQDRRNRSDTPTSQVTLQTYQQDSRSQRCTRTCSHSSCPSPDSSTQQHTVRSQTRSCSPPSPRKSPSDTAEAPRSPQGSTAQQGTAQTPPRSRPAARSSPQHSRSSTRRRTARSPPTAPPSRSTAPHRKPSAAPTPQGSTTPQDTRPRILHTPSRCKPSASRMRSRSPPLTPRCSRSPRCTARSALQDPSPRSTAQQDKAGTAVCCPAPSRC